MQKIISTLTDFIQLQKSAFLVQFIYFNLCKAQD